MKCVLVLLLCICAIYGHPDGDDIQQKFLKIAVLCRKETDLPADDFNKILKRELPTSPNGKCFLFCVHKKFGIVDETGKKNEENMKNLMEEVKELSPKFAEKIEIITGKCWPEIDENAEPCEGTYAVFQCYVKIAKEINLIISA